MGIIKRKNFLFFALGLLCLYLGCLCKNYDYDFFARLIVGQQILEHGILPFKDFLSYTPTHPWYDHEWGSGVVFYYVLKYFGAGGILFLHALLMFGVVFFVSKIQQLQKHAYPISLLFLTVFLLLFAHVNPLLIRCQMFSFLFFSIYLFLLEKYRKTNSKLIYIIPFLTIIWNNLHGGVVSGLGLLFIYFICSIFEKKNWKIYFFILSISSLLLIINPYGVKYLGFLFHAATMNRKYIIEWMPFFATRHYIYYSLPSLYVIFTAFCLIKSSLKKHQYDITKFTVVFVTLIEGLMHVKLLSLSLIVSASLCHNELCFIFRKIKFLLKKLEKCIYPSVILLSLTIPLFSPQYPRSDLYRFPLYEVEFLKINNIKGNIVVPFGFGSYVSYKLYPNNLIYMDGRYEEVYNDKEYMTLKNYEMAEKNWQDIINDYDTEILMPRKTAYIYEVLQKNKDWVHLFDGRCCGIFIKKDSLRDYYAEPVYGVDYYRRTMFDGYFGTKIRSYKE